MGKRRGKKATAEQAAPRIVEDVSDSEDEEIPEDEAFNSDDERKYGAFFQDNDHDEDDDEVTSGSDADDDDDDDGSEDTADGSMDDDEDGEDEEGDGGQYMLDLLSKLDASASSSSSNNNNNKANSNGGAITHDDGVESATTTTKKDRGLAAHVKESEFASTVVRGANVTLDSLMEGLEDTKGFGVMQKALKKVSQGRTTSAPVPRIVAERARRNIQYEDQSKEVSLWLDSVQENRRAETLDFRQRERIDILTKNKLVAKFIPTTDFEQEIQAALEAAGEQDEKAMAEREARMFQQNGGGLDGTGEDQDDLGSSELTLEEFKKRHGELAKMRALMFYHEQKRHHINKIKSKKYRRIRKKQRERLKEDELAVAVEEDPDLAKELEEKEEVDRMRERMTLAHKNTSKWAKRVLKRGKNVDVDTRRALSAQLQQGNDLRRKMNQLGGGGSDDEDGDDEEDLVDTARKVLKDTEDDEDEALPQKGLFKLSFMQKGIERQRQRAKEEAQRLLDELEANADTDAGSRGRDVGGGGEDDNDESSTQPQQQGKKKRKKVSSKAEMKELIGTDKLTVDVGASSSLALSGNIEINLDGPAETNGADETKPPKTTPTKATTASKKGSVNSSHEGTMDVRPQRNEKDHSVDDGEDKDGTETTSPSTTTTMAVRSRQAKTKRTRSDQDADEDEANPWLAAAEQEEAKTDKANATPSQSAKKRRKQGVNKAGIVDVEGAVDLLTEPAAAVESTTKAGATNQNDGQSSGKKKKNKRKNKKKNKGNEQPDAQTNSKENDGAIGDGTPETSTDAPNTVAPNTKSIASMTQEELVKHAFAGTSEQEAEEEFAKEKAEAIEREEQSGSKKRKVPMTSATTVGWGCWTGLGAPIAKPPKNLPRKLRPPPPKKQKNRERRDDKIPNVILNEQRVKKTAGQFQLAQIPHPFSSREEYERAMRGGIGKEWNVTGSFKDKTRPSVLTRAGKIIQPLSKRAKQPKRGPAKF